MANTRQAKKRARQAETHRSRNAAQRSSMRTHLKGTRKSIQDGKKEEAKAAYIEASSSVDKLAKKGLIRKNTAARYKSRLAKHLKKISVAGAA